MNIQEVMHITWFSSYNKYSRFQGPTQRKDDVPSAQEIPLLRWDNLMIIRPEQWAPKPARRHLSVLLYLSGMIMYGNIWGTGIKIYLTEIFIRNEKRDLYTTCPLFSCCSKIRVSYTLVLWNMTHIGTSYVYQCQDSFVTKHVSFWDTCNRFLPDF